MFCQKCGNKIEDNEKFCVNCGSSVSIEDVLVDDGIDLNKIKNIWKKFQNLGAVVVNLITLFVILNIYSNLYDHFEIITVCLLILIYLSIQVFSIGSGNFALDNFFMVDAEFRRLRHLICPNSQEENEELQSIVLAKIKTEKLRNKMYINIAFIFIFYLIVLYNLFGAL